MGVENKDKMYEHKFMGVSGEYNNADTIIFGVPMDFTCSYRSGTRFGPQKIREASISIEEYSVYQDKLLDDYKYFDCGDLELPLGDLKKSLDAVGEAVEEVMSTGKKPLVLGGEHLISLPLVKKMHEKYRKDLVLLHFDAHADLRDDYLGVKYSHASVIKRITDFMPAKNIYQFGVRSGSREELDFGKKNTNLFLFDVLNPLKSVLGEISDRPIYITFDIDVFDPAFANGTGNPEPGGIDTREMIDAIMLLKGLNVVGFDIVEVSPPYDISDRTAVLAAKIIREMIMILGKNINISC